MESNSILSWTDLRWTFLSAWYRKYIYIYPRHTSQLTLFGSVYDTSAPTSQAWIDVNSDEFQYRTITSRWEHDTLTEVLIEQRIMDGSKKVELCVMRTAAFHFIGCVVNMCYVYNDDTTIIERLSDQAWNWGGLTNSYLQISQDTQCELCLLYTSRCV